MDLPPDVLAPHRVGRVEPLRGGAKKAVSRLHCDDGFTCILYEWTPEAAYAGVDAADGPAALAHNHGYLRDLGVRTPEVLHRDASWALVEDLGDRLYMGDLARLGTALARMHGHRRVGWGPLAEPRRTVDPPCERVVLQQTRRDLVDLGRMVAGFVPAPLTDRVLDLFDRVSPRSDHGLIHGELGPEHVRADPDGQPCLIDIEGAKFFDVEYEHSFLTFRWKDRYPALRAEGLDAQRLRFYRLSLHLHYAAGPLRIIARGYPDAAGMRAIADANLAAAQALVEGT